MYITKCSHNEVSYVQKTRSIVSLEKLANINSHPPVESIDINRCVVIGNLAESDGKPIERIEADYAAVNQLINDIDAEVKVTECFRMGFKKPGSPRLLKVKLQTSAQQKTLLQCSKNIKGSDYENSKLYIRKSMTAQQRQLESDIRTKMIDRIAELKKSNSNINYCIYASRICIKQLNGKPQAIDDPLNGPSRATGNNAIPVNNMSF